MFGSSGEISKYSGRLQNVFTLKKNINHVINGFMNNFNIKQISVLLHDIKAIRILFKRQQTKRLLVFINPKKRKKERRNCFFAKGVMPVFEFCEVQSKVIGRYFLRKFSFISGLN